MYVCVSCSVVCNSLQSQRLACQASLSMDSPGKSGFPFPSPGDLPNPGIEPGCPALQADSLPSELPGKPIYIYILKIMSD